MLLEIGAALLGAAISSAEDDAKAENVRLTAQQNHRYQMELEEKRIEAQKRQNRHETAEQIIGGIFRFLEAAASSSPNEKN